MFIWQPCRRACQLPRQTKSVKCVAKQEVPQNMLSSRRLQMYRHARFAKCIVTQTLHFASLNKLDFQNFDDVENPTVVLILGVHCLANCAIRVGSDDD
ncbi:hypothetical protein Y032_0002g864 [Ancylostoma ceylanicum]|uniref:Uncharacterized protein n=1 Tax=Ancylostoma ceylanicum TaxID=53326 RepID=A0A016W1Y4_9BILA|nr:hypothetical protein Y032_0002g864 [Ancylostoma ceylanicum]